MQFFQYGDREEMWALLLDSKNRLIGTSLISVGSLSTSLVHPREAMKPAVSPKIDNKENWRNAVQCSAAAVIFCHNHPSGDPAPSREDRDCTKRLVEAGKLLGIRVLDHVIIGDNDYFSFADAGLLESA
jgi:DNA repair protein RadC